jgi:hypothetical protein
MAAAGAATAQSPAETVEGNDNRRPAGILGDGALTVRIYAARGDWRPERDEGPALNVTAADGQRHHEHDLAPERKSLEHVRRS